MPRPPASAAPGATYAKDTLIKGQPARITCVDVCGQTFSLAGGLLSVLRLEDEWLSVVEDPHAVIAAIEDGRAPLPDLFTFCQRLPDVEPRHAFAVEYEAVAALRVHSYEQWWNTQIKNTTRNMVRKSQKAGVVVRECEFDDAFVAGMTAIFNEASIRQGRPFWHYGKDVETVRQQFSRFLAREDLIGAYLGDELIGFAMLGRSAGFADIGQVIAKVAHRDKAVPNALIAKCVEVCARRGLPHLVYAYWTDSSLGQFKKQSGFEEVRLPRYYVPMTMKGKLALKAGLHKGPRHLVPVRIQARLREARAAWHARVLR